jgi:class 3 adenylate cyclase
MSADEPPRAASLKHELRTPLNHIIGYSEVLLEEAQDPGREIFIPDLQRIHAGGRGLLAVIDELFESRGGKPDGNALQHEIRTQLNEIIGYSEMLQEAASDHGQTSSIPDFQKIHLAARHLLELVSTRLVEARRPGDKPAEGASTFVRRESLAGPHSAVEVTEVLLPVEPGSLLVVEDNEPSRDMLARRLERLGHTVARAENGREALDKMRAGQFDVVLLDIHMPVMNGYQVLEQMQADPELRALPVIVLSASDESQSVIRCIQMGAEDHLGKPFDPVLLQARINACLEKKRFRNREVSYLRQIQEEKQRTDELLHIILPREVAAELRATDAVQPRRFEHVGVLFCDIVGFTAFSERRQPEEIVGYLQSLVGGFEKIAARHGLEKIKTIGDAFMATAGLLTPLESPELNCVRCGLDMITTARELPPHWQLRVGVHAGPVVAGIVGRMKYQYDVWGATVNTASRMEQAATAGSVCVNAETWQRLKHLCAGQSQGVIKVKGKGEQEIFRIDSVLES